MLSDELLDYIFDGSSHLLSPSMQAWLTGSRRFAAFVDAFRDKIRKKRRATHDPDSLMDLRLEWETAYLLLQERAFSLVYEPQPTGQSRRLRAPDFAVTYTTRFTFRVEVTRLRRDFSRVTDGTHESVFEPTAIAAPNAPGTGQAAIADAAADAACDKLGQMVMPGSHVLLIGVEALTLTTHDLDTAMRRVQHRVERNDAVLLKRHGFRDRADFFRQYQRLSEVIVRGAQSNAAAPVVWVNPQAKYPLPGKVRTALYRSLAG